MKPAPAIFLLLTLSLTGYAAPAQLDTIWPAGGKRGSEIEVTLTGKLEPWPVKLHFSEKGFTFAPDAEKKGTGKIKIAADAKPGPVLVRALTPEGASAPVFFLVDERNEILETEEDKNKVSGAQKIDGASLPLVINGKIPANNELDSFRLALKKGETIHAAVEGYTLRSLIDPVLQIYDSAGNRLLLEHDSATHLDPVLSFTAPAQGDYFIAVTAFAHPPAASVYFRGEKKAQYRLHLAKKREEFPARLLPTNPGPDSSEAVLQAGKPLIGTLGKANEVDSIQYSAKKGQLLLLRVESASLGFPTDPVLRLLKPDGALLKLVDDANKESDPEYLWRVAADGDYTIELSDRFHRGGAGFRYRLSATEPKPDFTATTDKSEYLLEPEKTVEIKVKVGRLYSHKSDLLFEIPGLPSSIKLTGPDKVPEKGGDVTVKLEAAKGAAAFQKEISLQVFEKGEDGKKSGKPKAAIFSFKDDNYRGPYAIMETPSLWLTIPPPPPKKEEKKDAAKDKEKEKKK